MTDLQSAAAVAAEFEFTNDDIVKCFEHFVLELNAGLKEQTEDVYQIPTYVTRVAHGTEKGFCLGVDLGGADFKVCSVELHENSTLATRQTKLIIPEDLIVAQQARGLFSFVASAIKAFLQEHYPEHLHSTKILNLGLCFAFPVDQTSVNSGILLRWTKDFDIKDAVGKDVCRLLQQELDNLELPVKVTAIVNDALGTIMSRAFTLPVTQTRTSIGVILSTGTNAVYLEQLSKITKRLGDHDSTTGEMFLNTEWGSLDSKLQVLPNTIYDQEVDKYSINKGGQMFEKRVSSLFLGELLRLAVEKLYDDPNVAIFPNFRRGDRTLLLRNRWSIDSSFLSVVEKDDSQDLNLVRKKIEMSFGIPSWAVTLEDAQGIQEIALAIGKRAARLAGTALGAVIEQSGRLEQVESITISKQSASRDEGQIVDIAVDGSVFELYPHFEQYMRDALKVTIGPKAEKRIRIGLARDGSSIGAAIIAYLAAQQSDATKN